MKGKNKDLHDRCKRCYYYDDFHTRWVCNAALEVRNRCPIMVEYWTRMKKKGFRRTT